MSGSGGTSTGGLDRVTVARHLPSLVLCLSLGVAVGAVLSLASWVLSGGAAERPPQTFEYVIPAGTSERIQAGDGFRAIPSGLTFLVGDSLVLRNDDGVPHAMGPYPVQAGSTLRISLREPTTRSYVCTFHPAGTVDLAVRGRPGAAPLVWSALLLGLPLGAGGAGVLWVARGLED